MKEDLTDNGVEVFKTVVYAERDNVPRQCQWQNCQTRLVYNTILPYGRIFLCSMHLNNMREIHNEFIEYLENEKGMVL